MTPAEVPQVVKVAVEETRGRVPVLAGTGYGTAIARDIAACNIQRRRAGIGAARWLLQRTKAGAAEASA